MKINLLHPTGNSNVRAVINGLQNTGLLAYFNTTIAIDPVAIWLKLLPTGVRSELLRRSYPLSLHQVTTHPIRELCRMIMPKIGLSKFTKGENAWAGIDAVYKSLDISVARKLPQLAAALQVTAVYGYEDGALNTFTSAKKLGLSCIYDLPIAYWETARKLMEEEANRLPSWAITLAGGITDSPAKLDRKVRELEMADMVICPSQFVLDSLPLWSTNKKKIMAPFGTPVLQDGEPAIKEKIRHNRPLRILFAGSLSQRKGLGDLFAAFHLLKSKQVELVVMGAAMTTMKFYKTEMPGFIFEPGRSHHEVLKLMRTCDIFCLPSIVEGRALVMQEAMSQGLPLIITPNTGGADLIREGLTGFLIPIRSPESIAEKINWFLDNRKKIPAMGAMAQEHAAQYTWTKYQASIVTGLKTFFH